jgi:hypothetical protein
VDASFAVHPDFKSHTSAVMMAGKRSDAIDCKKTKDEHAEQYGRRIGCSIDNAATMILWPKLFLEAQGYDVEKNIVYQDNKSAILLETNGKKSSGKRTRVISLLPIR